MRNKLITVFVIGWLTLFLYESLLYFNRDWRGIKFLFPPAGWIMFYNVGESYGYAEVYGVKDGRTQAIDPHQILQTRAIGYDNIHRNALVSVLDQHMARSFCVFLRRRFPYFDNFIVTYVNYPSVTQRPFEKQQAVAYECASLPAGS